MSDETEFLAKVRLEFLQEASDLLDDCEEALLNLNGPFSRENSLAEVFRAIHTIKGSGAAVGFVDLVEFAHEVEDCLAALRTYPDQLTTELTSLLLACVDTMRLKVRLLSEGNPDIPSGDDLVQKLKSARSDVQKIPGVKAPLTVVQAFGVFGEEDAKVTPEAAPQALPPAESPACLKRETVSIKVDSGRIDSVLDLVGELVVLRSQLINKTEPYASDTSLAAVVTLLDKTVRELQDKALAIRMMPIKPLFMKMQRMARDLAIKIGKSVEFELEGEDTELDRMVVESLSDPLLHLVRNAIDHGIERSSERRQTGKNEVGVVRLMAFQSSGRIVCGSSMMGAASAGMLSSAKRRKKAF